MTSLKNLFSMILFERCRAIHKYTQNVHGSNKFLIASLSLRACCLFSCRGPQRETRGGRGEFIPSIHHRGGGAGGWRVKKKQGNEETRVFFFVLLSKERGKLSFLTAGLSNLFLADWRLTRQSCDHSVKVTSDFQGPGEDQLSAPCDDVFF